MKHSKKYLVCAFMVGASFVACCVQPMTAKGIEISFDEQAGIQDYLQAGKQGLLNIDFQLDEDEDGNRSTRLQIQGLQNLTFNEQFRVYDNMDFSVAPDSISMSGGGLSLLYRNYYDNNVYPVMINLLASAINGSSFTFASAKDFTVQCEGYQPGIRFTSSVDKNWTSSAWRVTFGMGRPTQYNNPWGTYSISGSLADYSYDLFSSTGGIGKDFLIDKTHIPTIQRLNDGGYIGGMGQELILPPGDYDSTKPWEYYNDTLLPYMRQNFNITNIEDYFVFPNGYSPDPSHTTAPVSTTIPIIYPTAPVFDQGLDESGTQPTGIESINYELPQLETKTVGIPAFDLTSLNPNQVMQPLSNGLAGLWALVTDLLNTFELFPLVSLALLVGVIGGLLLLGR